MSRRTRTVALVACVAAALAAWGAYRLGLQRGTAAHVAAPAGAASDPGRRVLYWHDPMVPGTKFDRPGKSPFMDMALVPVYADAPGAGDGVAISPRVQQNLGLRTAAVERGRVAPLVEAGATVGWNERDAAVVAARAAGYVERLHARTPYERVARGQALAEVYVPEWVAAQEEFLALRRAGGAELVDAARARMRQAGMSEAQIAAVEAAGRVQPRLTLVAPIAGVLAEVNVREGAAVAAGTPLLRIAGVASVWVNAEVPESQAARVRVGQRAEVVLASGLRASGRVAALLPEVNPATRTVKVRIELPNPRGEWLPGLYANVRLAPEAREGVLLVPSQALIATGRRDLVMLAEGEGRFRPVEVERGLEADGRTEIRKGLVEGQQVVVSGQFLVDSEASLKGVEARQGDAERRP